MKAHNRRAEKKICIARWHPRLEALVQELKTQNTAEQEIAVSVLENDASLSLAAAASDCIILYTGAYSNRRKSKETLESARHLIPSSASTVIITDSDAEASIARALFPVHTVVIAVESLHIRIIAQTARQTALAQVYEELLSFAGNEIYTIPASKLSGLQYSRSLRFYENACIAGLVSGGSVRLNPPMNTVIRQEDQIVLIARDLETLEESPAILPAPDNSAISKTSISTTRAESFLVLGWNPYCLRLLQELAQYTGKGSSVRLVRSEQMETPTIPALEVSAERMDLQEQQVLESFVYEYYENIIVVDDREVFAKVQALLTARGLANNLVFFDDPSKENTQAQRVFKLSAQAALHPAVASVFDALANPEGSEIYLKPAENYISINNETDFYTIIEAARRLDETAIGYILHETGQLFINPPKDQKHRFYHFDKIIVLSDHH